MLNIKELLLNNKILGIKHSSETAKNTIREVLFVSLGLSIANEDIIVKGGKISLNNIPNIVKSEILLKKGTILNQINDGLKTTKYKDIF
jgi:hypothetical protein